MKKQRHDNHAERGFTLVEIMIALFILSIGIMGVTSMFISTIKANQLARNNTAASRLLQNLVEQVKTGAFTAVGADICTTAGVFSCTVGDLTLNPALVTGKYKEGSDLNAVTYDFTVRQDKDTAGTVPVTDLDTFTITVTWTDSYGAHTDKAITYIED